MKDDRLQLRVPAKLKKAAGQVARRRGTTVSALVTQYLQNLVEADKIQKLTGEQHDAEQI